MVVYALVLTNTHASIDTNEHTTIAADVTLDIQANINCSMSTNCGMSANGRLVLMVHLWQGQICEVKIFDLILSVS